MASAQPLHSHSSISQQPPRDDERGLFSSAPFPRGEKFVKKSRKPRHHRLAEANPPTIFKDLHLHRAAPEKKSDGFDSLCLSLMCPLAKGRAGGLQPPYCRGTWTYFCTPRAQKAGKHKSCSCHRVAGRNAAPNFKRPIKSLQSPLLSPAAHRPSPATSLAPAAKQARRMAPQRRNDPSYK